ncbi:MAG: hypothetical protein A4E64_02486 [Syntrophorhabdus sp. PtaU1.Bin058]|nr:MAG: hypothetical protein A4E64_02486 [Syntrophorhabdus sp. PtaU1.Bin058]
MVYGLIRGVAVGGNHFKRLFGSFSEIVNCFFIGFKKGKLCPYFRSHITHSYPAGDAQPAACLACELNSLVLGNLNRVLACKAQDNILRGHLRGKTAFNNEFDGLGHLEPELARRKYIGHLRMADPCGGCAQ